MPITIEPIQGIFSRACEDPEIMELLLQWDREQDSDIKAALLHDLEEMKWVKP